MKSINIPVDTIRLASFIAACNFRINCRGLFETLGEFEKDLLYNILAFKRSYQ